MLKTKQILRMLMYLLQQFPCLSVHLDDPGPEDWGDPQVAINVYGHAVGGAIHAGGGEVKQGAGVAWNFNWKFFNGGLFYVHFKLKVGFRCYA